MEKQIRIIIKGGVLQTVITNFECAYQLIDYDDVSNHILEPDLVLLDEDIFNMEVE